MKYDPRTKHLERNSDDRERHRQVRERLRFSTTPTSEAVATAVDALVSEGLLPLEPVDADLEALAQVLRTERERLGLSRAEIAQRTGWAETIIHDLETGQEPNPPVRTLTSWAKALGKQLRISLSDA